MTRKPETSFAWQPIADLSDSHERLASSELRSLAAIWEEQKTDLQASESVREFNEKLLRRWAVETGLIERLYTLDRGITQLLVERGFNANFIPQHATDKDPEWVVRILRDQHEVAEGLFDFVVSRRELTASYIKELHAALTANQPTTQAVDTLGRSVEVPLRRGDYKQRPNNPLRPDGTLHEYCPPDQVSAEMDRLIAMHRDHVRAGIAPEIEAAWLHHRFTQIHPFQDGNGRVARALATLVFLQANGLPLVVTDDERGPYIDALEEADRGNLAALCTLFSRIERRALVQALSAAQEIPILEEKVQTAVEAIRDTVKKRRESPRAEWETAKTRAAELVEVAYDALNNTASTLEKEVGPLASSEDAYEFFADREAVGGERGDWFRQQVVRTADTLDYAANTGIFHTWSRLVLNTENTSEIVVSFHGLGPEFRGLLMANACFFRRDLTEGNGTTITDTSSLTDEPFQINYREPEKDVKRRFERWLDQVILTGLETFRRSL